MSEDAGYDDSEYVDDSEYDDEDLLDALHRLEEGMARRTRERAAEPSLRAFATGWDAITLEQVELFRHTLQTAETERDMQKLFEAYPILLVQPLGGGHGRWVIPQKRLGSEHVPDFMLAERSSIGFEWTAVELESPNVRMFTKRGEFSMHANHALGQIEDWRVWLGRNRDYAVRPRDASGLGLVDIDNNVPGWVILGRRSDLSPKTRERRRERSRQLNIKLHSYDWLLEQATRRAEWAESQRRR